MSRAIAGYMVVSIPIIATAIIKGGEVAFQAVTGSNAIQSAASSEGASASKGLVTQDAVSFDQQQLAPNRTSAFMSSITDAHGTTIQVDGAGPAGRNAAGELGAGQAERLAERPQQWHLRFDVE